MTTLPLDFYPEIYLLLNPDVKAAGANPVKHWLNHGQFEGRSFKVADSEEAKQKLRESGIFDPVFYAETYPDIAAAGLDAESHYLTAGAKEGRWASHYFRTDWYADRYPEARASNPLFYYLDHGAALRHDPNPFFETDYYVRQYGTELNGMEPLKHFILNGHLGFSPSPRFDSAQYTKENGTGELNPLLHYLQQGLAEGIAPCRSMPTKTDEQVESAWLDTLQVTANRSLRNALLITHTSNGHIKPHVTRLAQSLVKSGYAVHLIIAADVRTIDLHLWLRIACSSIFVRENVGYDFAAWAHLMKAYPWLMEGDELLLTNDSICGPIQEETLGSLTQRIRENEADIVGLTNNYEYADHLQSYYLSLKSSALQHPAVKTFFQKVVNLPDKSQVIREYEITLTARARRAGLVCTALYPPYRDDRNPTIWDWSRLLDDGFPFVKMSLISGEARDMFKEEVMKRLYDERFPTDLVEAGPPTKPTRNPDYRFFFSKWKEKITEKR